MVENLTETHIITGYDVYYSTPNTQTSMYVSVEAATVTDSVAVIGGLRPFTNYTFTVRIKTEYGDTQRSEPWWIVTTNASGKLRLFFLSLYLSSLLLCLLHAYVHVCMYIFFSTTCHKLFFSLNSHFHFL